MIKVQRILKKLGSLGLCALLLLNVLPNFSVYAQDNETVKVTFEAGNGKFGNETSKVFTIKKGSTFDESGIEIPIPTPLDEDYRFVEWEIKDDGALFSTKQLKDFSIDIDMTCIAQYKLKANASKFLLRIGGDEGMENSGALIIDKGTKWSDIKEDAKQAITLYPNYIITSWINTANEVLSDDTVFNEETLILVQTKRTDELERVLITFECTDKNLIWFDPHALSKKEVFKELTLQEQGVSLPELGSELIAIPGYLPQFTVDGQIINDLNFKIDKDTVIKINAVKEIPEENNPTPDMEELNSIPTITASDKVLTVGDTFNPLDGVTAYDKEDKDIILTQDNIISNNVDMTKAGTYTVTYKVTDSQGASSIKTITVIVNPKMEILNNIPVITASDKVLTVGDTFNPLDGVTAYDKEDKDIILTQDNIISNNVDMTKAGTYTVTYKVTDSQGASSIKTITVIVNPKMEILNNIPVITASDKVLTVGDTFNPLDGVTAYDKEDKDIILTQDNIISNNVDMTKAGTYTVTYKVTDSQGASSIKTITVIVNPKMEILNNIPVITASDKVLTVGDTFNPLDGVTAYDKEDKDIILTQDNIISNNVDMTKAGTYTVTYKVTDSQGASSIKTITVIVNPKMEILNNIPVITASDKVLTVGDTFNPLDGVTAYDKEDKDIILTQDNIISNNVDMTKAGTYTVTYKVTDSQGASSIKTITVIVNPKMEILNNIPVITASDKVLTVGDTFNPLDGVTAYDKEDKDIILTQDNIISNNVDMTKAGTYTVTYKVTDSQGASSIKTITVIVNPKMEILNNIPVITASDKVLTVGDTFNPLDGVTAYDKEDKDIILTQDNIISNNVDMTKAGTYTVTYKVTDSQGASSIKTITVVVKSKSDSSKSNDETTNNGNQGSKPSENKTLPMTGYDTNLAQIAIVLVLSGSVLLSSKLIKKRRKV